MRGPETTESRVSPEQLARVGVTVRIPATLRMFTDGQDEVILEGADLAALLRRLDEAFPGIREHDVDETGSPRRPSVATTAGTRGRALTP